MPKRAPSNSILALERQILQALCVGADLPDDWDLRASQLAGYRWLDSDHKVVFEALRAIKSRDARTRRDELPAQATRMGFPDVDWKPYFEPDEERGSDLEDLIRRLKEPTPDRS
jgi:hypothetical protein